MEVTYEINGKEVKLFEVDRLTAVTIGGIADVQWIQGADRVWSAPHMVCTMTKDDYHLPVAMVVHLVQLVEQEGVESVRRILEEAYEGSRKLGGVWHDLPL